MQAFPAPSPPQQQQQQASEQLDISVVNGSWSDVLRALGASAPAPSLQAAAVSSPVITDDMLLRLQRVRSLTLSACQLTPEHILQLPVLPALEELDLSDNPLTGLGFPMHWQGAGAPAPALDDTAAQPDEEAFWLAFVPQCRRLCLRGCSLSRIPPLIAAVDLEALDVSCNNLVNVRGLEACPSLRTLSLAFNNLPSLVAVRPLSALSSVRFLSLHPNPCTLAAPLQQVRVALTGFLPHLYELDGIPTPRSAVKGRLQREDRQREEARAATARAKRIAFVQDLPPEPPMLLAADCGDSDVMLGQDCDRNTADAASARHSDDGRGVAPNTPNRMHRPGATKKLFTPSVYVSAQQTYLGPTASSQEKTRARSLQRAHNAPPKPKVTGTSIERGIDLPMGGTARTRSAGPLRTEADAAEMAASSVFIRSLVAQLAPSTHAEEGSHVIERASGAQLPSNTARAAFRRSSDDGGDAYSDDLAGSGFVPIASSAGTPASVDPRRRVTQIANQARASASMASSMSAGGLDLNFSRDGEAAAREGRNIHDESILSLSALHVGPGSSPPSLPQHAGVVTMEMLSSHPANMWAANGESTISGPSMDDVSFLPGGQRSTAVLLRSQQAQSPSRPQEQVSQQNKQQVQGSPPILAMSHIALDVRLKMQCVTLLAALKKLAHEYAELCGLLGRKDAMSPSSAVASGNYKPYVDIATGVLLQLHRLGVIGSFESQISQEGSSAILRVASLLQALQQQSQEQLPLLSASSISASGVSPTKLLEMQTQIAELGFIVSAVTHLIIILAASGKDAANQVAELVYQSAQVAYSARLCTPLFAIIMEAGSSQL
jgi:hypothetical protein